MLCLLLAATAGCDRVTKHYAVTTLAGQPSQSYLGDTIRLDYHENTGGFLSAGAAWSPSARTVVFQIANGVFLFGTLILAHRYQWSRLAATGLILFVAGGVSNWIDRVAIGGVVDFLNLGIGSFRTGISTSPIWRSWQELACSCSITIAREAPVCNAFPCYMATWAETSWTAR